MGEIICTTTLGGGKVLFMTDRTELVIKLKIGYVQIQNQSVKLE